MAGRLAAVAEWVPVGSVVADIGTDHGYLPIYLVESGISPRVIATDIKAGPLAAAEKNIHEHRLSHRIETRLGDGLQPLQPAEAEVIVLAGMGSKTIIDILTAAPEIIAKACRLIMQPMAGGGSLRLWLAANNWRLDRERLLLEGKRLYQVIVAVPGKEETEDRLILALGPRLIEERDPLLPLYLEQLLTRHRQTLAGLLLGKSQEAVDKAGKLRKEIEQIVELKGVINMSVTCRDVFGLIEKLAPLKLAEKWDNPGLQVGEPGQEVRKVLLALDVNEKVVQEAVEKGVQLIVSHHPLIFTPIKSLDLEQPAGRLLKLLIEKRIAVYSAHTNLDVAQGGVNTALAAKLGLENPTLLNPTGQNKYYKLVVFVPQGHEQEVHQAISEAGAGWIGQYSHCAFQTEGTGMFKPTSGAKPFIGEEEQLSQVAEVRMETVVPAERSAQVVRAMIQAHPYEEVAYDLYPLENPGVAYGLGLVGRLPATVSFERFIQQVKEALGLPTVAVGGDLSKTVRVVAVCGGSGARLWPRAIAAGAQVYLTGDVGHHDAQDMLNAGLSFIDAGHYGSEAVVLPALREYLEEQCSGQGLAISFDLAVNSRSPFVFI